MLQLGFATSVLGPNGILKNGSVLLDGGNEENTKMRVPKVLLLFPTQVEGCENEKNFAFVPYVNVGPSHDNLNNVLGCVRLRKSAHDETDYILEKRYIGSGEQPLSTEEWYGFEPLLSIQSIIHAVRKNFAVALFVDDVLWPLGCFYVNVFMEYYCRNW